MTENQKLREALSEARSVISSINRGAQNALTVSEEKVFWQREEWVLWAVEEVLPIIEQALALPTAEQVDDINVAESFTSVTKTAAPVGERERFEKEMTRLFGYSPHAFGKDRNGDYAERHIDEFYMVWQARAALSAGDAVDGLPGMEPVAWIISVPDEPDLGSWLSEEPGADYCKSEPLCAAAAVQQYKVDAQRWRYAMDWGTKDFAVCMRVGATGVCWEPIKTDGPIDAAMRKGQL